MPGSRGCNSIEAEPDDGRVTVVCGLITMIDEPPFWVIWNPHHPMPPTSMHKSRASATREAKRMAAKFAHEGAYFYVLKVQSCHQMQGKMINTLMSDWGVGVPCQEHHERPPLMQS